MSSGSIRIDRSIFTNNPWRLRYALERAALHAELLGGFGEREKAQLGSAARALPLKLVDSPLKARAVLLRPVSTRRAVSCGSRVPHGLSQ